MIRTQEIKGAPSCRNLGLHKANGEFIIFLDADDVMLPFCIQQRIDAMNRNPDLLFGVFLQRVLSLDPIINGKTFNILETSRAEILKLFLEFQIPWQTTAPMWKKSFVMSLGGFNTEYKRMEDPDIHVRALFATDKFKCFYQLPHDCIYSINYHITNIMPNYDFIVHDAEIYFKSITYQYNRYRSLSDQEVRRSLSKGIIYFIRYFVIRDYDKYFSYLDQILNTLKVSKLISVPLFFKIRLLHLVHSNKRIDFPFLLAKKFINRFVFNGLKKYKIT